MNLLSTNKHPNAIFLHWWTICMHHNHLEGLLKSLILTSLNRISGLGDGWARVILTPSEIVESQISWESSENKTL